MEEFELPAVAADEETEHESILIAPPAMSDEAMLDFDFSIGEETPEAEPAAAQQAAPNIDLSDISLDLGASTEGAEAKPAVEEANRFQEAATKLDLAKAYIEMGDQEGAREILQEVIVEGSDEQQDDAKKLLAELA
jgi:pilus assembly protein FimV